MLLTVTPNSALDRSLVAPNFRSLDVCRIREVKEAAGGKGLNVSRVAKALDFPTRACGVLAGETGRKVAALAEAEGIEASWYWLRRGETRTCTLLIDPEQGDDLALNEAGPAMIGAEWGEFARIVRKLAPHCDALVFCGSLPSDVPYTTYVRLLRELSESGFHVVLDTSGPALRNALSLPLTAIKVNAHELGEAMGRPINSIEDALEAASSVIEQGPKLVSVTLGASGAVAVTAEERCVAVPPALKPISTVGSGDAFLAGLVVSLLRDIPLPEALRMAVACGSVNAGHIGGGITPAHEVAQMLSQVQVEVRK